MRAFERPVLLPLVMEMFGPLVSGRGRITQAHLRSLEDCVLHTWSSTASRQEWLHSIRAALHLCQRAADWYPQALGLHLYSAIDRVGPVQMEIGMLRQRFWNCGRASRPDERFRPILDLYTCLYERLYLLLATPVVAAHALLNGGDVTSAIANDGRIRPATVQQLETQRDFRQGLLTAGLDTHVRNSISHGRYRVLSGDAIEMEDRRPPDNKLTWGPHVFSHGQLYDKTVELDLT